jgi:hypothetical protein
VTGLEAAKKEGESYKVLFLGRHGQGWHNVAEAKYGTKAWDVCSSYSFTTCYIPSHLISNSFQIGPSVERRRLRLHSYSLTHVVFHSFAVPFSRSQPRLVKVAVEELCC